MLVYMWANQDKASVTVPVVMVNGDTIFTITGGPIQIVALQSICVTANNGTASTLQYSSPPTVGDATVFSGASASLASAAAGSVVTLAPTALSTAPTLTAASAGGVVLGTDVANRIIVQAGTITVVIGVGSTTGTWRHCLRYVPLTSDSLVTP